MRAYCILLPNGSPGHWVSGDQADLAHHGVVRMYVLGLSQSGTVISLPKTAFVSGIGIVMLKYALSLLKLYTYVWVLIIA